MHWTIWVRKYPCFHILVIMFRYVNMSAISDQSTTTNLEKPWRFILGSCIISWGVPTNFLRQTYTVGVPFRTRSKYMWIYLVRLAYNKVSHSIHVWVYYGMLYYNPYIYHTKINHSCRYIYSHPIDPTLVGEWDVSPTSSFWPYFFTTPSKPPKPSDTPLKINMEHTHGDLEDHVPF